MKGVLVDAITLLKDDHKTVEKLFKKFEKAGDGAKKTKQKLVEQITAELTKHTYIEETIFYPAARKVVPETEDHVLESVEEHHIVVWLLSELAKLDPSTGHPLIQRLRPVKGMSMMRRRRAPL
jgi:hemerythrin-like domain-containing protein